MLNKNNYLICKQSNNFIRQYNFGSYDASEVKLFIYFISIFNDLNIRKNLFDNFSISANDNNIDFNKTFNYTFNTTDIIKKIYGFDTIDCKNSFRYTELKNNIKSLFNKAIYYNYLNDNGFKCVKGYHFINEFEYNDCNITIKFNSLVLLVIIDLLCNNNFTLFAFETFLKINNKYAQKLYMFFKSFESLSKNGFYLLDIELFDLYDLLLEKSDNGDFVCSYHHNFYNFKIKVLLPAIKELCKTDIKVLEFKKVNNNISFKLDFTNSDKVKCLDMKKTIANKNAIADYKKKETERKKKIKKLDKEHNERMTKEYLIKNGGIACDTSNPDFM